MSQRFACPLDPVEEIRGEISALPKLKVAPIPLPDRRENALLATPTRKAPGQFHGEVGPARFDLIFNRKCDLALMKI